MRPWTMSGKTNSQMHNHLRWNSSVRRWHGPPCRGITDSWGTLNRHMALSLLAVSLVKTGRAIVRTDENNIREEQTWAIPQGNVIHVQRVTTTQVDVVTSSTMAQSHSSQAG